MIKQHVIKTIIFLLKFFFCINLEIYIDEGINKNKAIKLNPPYLKLG